MSRFFSLSPKESDWRLHSAQENGCRKTSTQESQVNADISVVV